MGRLALYSDNKTKVRQQRAPRGRKGGQTSSVPSFRLCCAVRSSFALSRWSAAVTGNVVTSATFSDVLLPGGLQVKLAHDAREEAVIALALDPSNDISHHIMGRWHYEMVSIPSPLSHPSSYEVRIQ